MGSNSCCHRFALVVEYKCRLRAYGGFAAAEGRKAILVYLSLVAYNCVVALRDGHLALLLGGIEYDDDVAPVVAAGVVFQAEGHQSP